MNKAISFLVFFFLIEIGGMPAAMAQDCSLKQLSSVEMTVGSENLVVPATIGGVGKKFELSLSSGLNGITDETARELKLDIRSAPPNSTIYHDGALIKNLAYADSFQLGALAVKRLPFLLLPPEIGHGDIAGDLGGGMFANMDFELDMAGGKLKLFSPDHCTGDVVYWTQSNFAQLEFNRQELGLIIVKLELDGQPVYASLHPSGKSLIGMNVMRLLFNIDKNSPGMTPVPGDGSGPARYQYSFKTLNAGGLVISNPAIEIYDQKPAPACDGKFRRVDVPYDEHPTVSVPMLVKCAGTAQLTLGLSLMKKMHFYFSTKEHLLYVTGANAH